MLKTIATAGVKKLNELRARDPDVDVALDDGGACEVAYHDLRVLASAFAATLRHAQLESYPSEKPLSEVEG